MDPLSVTAGIIAVLQISSNVVKYLADVRGAPESRKRLMVEISLTRGILGSVQLLTQGVTQDLLKEPLQECIKTLKYLENKLAPSDKRRIKFEQALRWPFDKSEIDETFRTLERQKSLFELALQNDQRALLHAIEKQQDETKSKVEAVSIGVAELQEGHRDQKRRHDEKKRQDILDWLSPLSFDTKQNDVYSQRQERTGIWLLEHPNFVPWINGNYGTLWCPGIAGAGKTVLSAIIVHYLLSRFQSSEIGIAWIYFDYRERDQQKIASLVACLVQQLARRRTLLSDELEDLYTEHSRTQNPVSLNDYSRLLHLETQRSAKTFLVIDALDECTEEGGTRRNLVAELQRLSSNVQVLFTSRPLPRIGELLDNPQQLEIRASKEDVRIYVETQLWAEDQLRDNLERDATLLEAIIHSVVDKTQGMFLLARLYLTALAQYDNPKRLRDALDRLPEEYSEVYGQVMRRIREQAPARKHRSLQVLSCLAYARAPLTATALQHALAVEQGDSDITEHALTNLNTLLSACLGLVVIDTESQEIRFVHYTTQEYFNNNRAQVLPDGPRSIALTCLNYLSLDELSQGSCKTKTEFVTRKMRYPFLVYAAKYWGHHARGEIEKVLQDQIITFLNHDGRRLCAHQCWNKDYVDSALNVAAALGLAHIVELLITQGASVSWCNEKNRQALHRAAEEGDYDDVVHVLLDHGAHVDAQRQAGWRPLHEAAKFGNDKVIRVLLERGAEILTHNHNAAPPFHEAVTYARHTSMMILLDGGADVKGLRPSPSYISPLHQTACWGRDETMRLLLKNGADIHQRDEEGRTALHRAAEHGQLTTTKTLIDENSDISAKDKWGKTPLAWAANRRHADVTRLLLETATQRLGIHAALTPLHHAAEHGEVQAVRVLLEQGAELFWKDELNRNPLRLAQQNGHTEIAELLVEHATRQLETVLECF
ncbi:MAG: hypothetical protein M1830_008336 [Pleopsidium flavum]|nr:MAG: hypothetical protein M1830_008336 [Pleopsidium flavum]